MKVETLQLPVKALEGFEGPAVSALHVQRDGTVLCGLLFSNPSLFRLKANEGGRIEATDLSLEREMGGGILGVINGLRPAVSGDTAFAVLHEGFAPSFLRKMAGGGLAGKTDEALAQALLEQDGGMGVSLRHSVVQMTEGDFVIRRFREPGALLDAAHIGDFVFGLAGGHIWKEPYLNSEKRETLRKDLSGNFALNRDSAGNFWLQGQEGRLLRMGQMDNKARPTTLRLPDWKAGASLELAVASPVDEWLFALTQGGRVLFRVRVNPISKEEEIQVVARFESPATGMAFLSNASESPTLAAPLTPSEEDAAPAPSPLAESTLVVALATPQGAELRRGRVVAAEDPELASAPPELVSVGRVEGVAKIGPMSWDGQALWAADGLLGTGVRTQAPKILRISDI